MNKDVFEGKWKQVRGEARVWWGKLSDDDLDKVAGKFEVFTGCFRKNMVIPACMPSRKSKSTWTSMKPG